jgi:undecaprenyl diphosphate synthase
MSWKEKIDLARLPRHVAVIMDGNGRWARQKGRLRTFGHKHGVTAVKETTEAAAELGIEVLTLYAFSTENWNRPQYEVDALMQLLVSTIGSEIKTLMDNDIRLETIGDTENLPSRVAKNLKAAIDKTSNNKRMTLVLALSYSSRWELIRAMQLIAADVKAGLITPAGINESTVTSHLCTKQYPDPELLIRTSGEYRISNFLLWQIAYAELYFTDKLWPDFNREDFYQSIVDYQSRERRFGRISEQITETPNA